MLIKMKNSCESHQKYFFHSGHLLRGVNGDAWMERNTSGVAEIRSCWTSASLSTTQVKGTKKYCFIV